MQVLKWREGGEMSFLLSDQSRLLALIVACAVFWSVESLLPLYKYETNHLSSALPNIELAVLLGITVTQK